MAAAAENRAELDLQISLLAEHEVTKLASVILAIASKLGVGEKAEGELTDAKRDIAPEAVLDAIENKFVSRPNRPGS